MNLSEPQGLPAYVIVIWLVAWTASGLLGAYLGKKEIGWDHWIGFLVGFFGGIIGIVIIVIVGSQQKKKERNRQRMYASGYDAGWQHQAPGYQAGAQGPQQLPPPSPGYGPREQPRVCGGCEKLMDGSARFCQYCGRDLWIETTA